MNIKLFGIMLLGFLGTSGMTTRVSIAQQAYPMLMSIEPVAAQIGNVSAHTIKSRYTMEDTYRVLVSGEGVTGEVIVPDQASEPAKSPLQSLAVRFVVADDALPGVRQVRLATHSGVSTVAPLVIAHDPLIVETATVETADNNETASATPFTIPATLCGGLVKPEDVDFYKFQALRGQTINFFVRCMKLQDLIHDLQAHADPILTLRDANGSTLAASDNVFGADPFLNHTFAADGDYFLEIRDVRYQGNPHWQYAIEVSPRPHVQVVFPLAVSPAQPTHVVTPIGYALADESQAVIELPQSVSTGVCTAGLIVDGQSRHSVQVVVDSGPFVSESSEPNDSLESAQFIPLPVGIHGRIGQASDIDYYGFEAKRGEQFTFEVFARRVGSPLDSHLRLLDLTGKQLQINDDLRDGKRTFSDSRIENWIVPADGRYILEIRDLNLRGGKEYVYFLKASSATPRFRLFTDTDKTLLTPGTSGVIFVRAERLSGFDGEIQLQVTGLPPGVTASEGRILAGTHVDGCIVLTVDQHAKPDVSNIEIHGVGRVSADDGQDQDISVAATIYQEIYQPGGGRGHWPVATHSVSIGTPADILSVNVTPQEVSLKPGESVTLDVELQRAPGFDKNVLLEVAYKHLNSVFGDPLPKGVTVDATASNTLLTGGATKGKITLKAAPDAVHAEKVTFAVMANVSINFVMKTTYASSPIVLTIAP